RRSTRRPTARVPNSRLTNRPRRGPLWPTTGHHQSGSGRKSRPHHSNPHRVITTVRPRRRRETSRASAEERIRTADARETEDLVATQIELRCILLDRIDRSELEPPTEGQHEA